MYVSFVKIATKEFNEKSSGKFINILITKSIGYLSV